MRRISNYDEGENRAGQGLRPTIRVRITLFGYNSGWQIVLVNDDLDTMASVLNASGRYRVLRRLEPRPFIERPDGWFCHPRATAELALSERVR